MQHITAVCPECQSRYQLNADLRGRKLRCPNPNCQTVFVVHAANGDSPPAGLLAPRVGSDAPTRPITVPRPGPVEEFDWRSAPPPVQAAGSEVPRGIPVAPPPARRPPPVQAPPPAPAREWDEPPDTGRRWGPRIIALLVFFIVSLIVGGGFVIYNRLGHAEEALRTEAEKDYASGSFHNAAKKYHALADGYGRSPRAAEYRFFADLSDLREAADRTPPDPAAALDRAEAFAKAYDTRDPLLKDRDRRDDVSRALAAVVTVQADAAEAAASSGEASTADPVARGKTALDLLRRFPPKDSDQIPKLDARLNAAAEALAKATERKRAVAEVLALLRRARPDVNAARRLAQRLRVADDQLVRDELRRVETELSHDVTYEAVNRPPRPDLLAADPPSLLLETAPAVRPPGPAGDVVLAVARGLLYALDGRDGRRLWACRVGLDAGGLPTRVPAAGDAPELVLVAASDPPGLTARDARTGAVAWHQPLEEPPLGRPVQNAGRLFVPTAGPRGLVYDLDARTGVCRGRFETHQPLAAGGAFDAATQRLYVPAHGQSVYVFNYDGSPRCEGALPTAHPAGSLRGEPIVVSGEEGLDVARYLVLGQADGLGAMKLRAFRLLDTATTSPLWGEVRLPGWSWFPPYHDPETIALVTDAGAIGLFGIQQTGTADPPLFPLLGETPNVKSQIPNGPSWDLGSGAWNFPRRAQLVHAEEYGFWVLADGVLRHWRLGLTRQSGRQLVPVWGRGVPLGSPLHAAQVSADRHTLYLVTQTDSPPADRATAVDAASGQVRWQRPLGLSVQGDPVDLGGAVVVQDQSGGLYRFDPREKGDIHLFPAGKASPAAGGTDGREKMNVPFFAGGKELAPPAADLAGAPYLLPAADGQSAWSFTVRPDGESFRLTVRRVAADGTVSGGSVPVPAPIGGTPALGPTAAILPLADGQLCRVTLDADRPRADLGPTWRKPGARPDARGRVVHWRGDEYLVGDGGRQLLPLSWPALDTQRPVELPQRVAGAPVQQFAPRDSRGAKWVAVADVGGTVTLLRGDRPTVARTWRVGPVTAGPWAVGDRLAVVVDRRRLVWLNPDADSPVWTYTTDGDGIESPPRLVDGKLVVADLAGRFAALDPGTGKAVGGGYQVPAEAAPAAAVAGFGPGRLFAPLTDGTALLLPLAELLK